MFLPGYRGIIGAGLVCADAGIGIGTSGVGGAFATAPPYPVHRPPDNVTRTPIVAHIVPAQLGRLAISILLTEI
jgi:hypothetical protein